MLDREQRAQEAARLMLELAQRTGLPSGTAPALRGGASIERIPQRYLWTDAFAVCNLLGLAEATREQRFAHLALEWVDQVHHVLGRHRPDDQRRGWISGQGESQGEAHPTRGGLRIGKPLPERAAGEAFDAQREWDRDGQYFHYLTRWMHALDQVARATGQARFNLWARELADSAHRAFTYDAGQGGRRMAWKMSIDLTRPLVSSMGHHDPLDGLITCVQLRATASMLEAAPSGPQLEQAIGDFAAISAGQDWVTTDALGLGGLLTDAGRIAWLAARGGFAHARQLLDAVLAAAGEGLSHYVRQRELSAPASQRLAFRELGLAIGLRALPLVERELQAESLAAETAARLSALEPYADLASDIESFWLEPEHRRTRTWLEHRDINDAMLATCLVPQGYLLGAQS